MWKALLAVVALSLVMAASALALPAPGPKTYSTTTPHQWVKGFRAPAPSYLDRRK
jgi:hypothetical protein